VALDLRNSVQIKPSRFFSISIRGEGADNVRLKGNNLFISIFNDHYKKLTGRLDRFRFVFHNNIPLSRGLGSSSAVIVSALAAAYAAAGVEISREDLLHLAFGYEHHPDNITPAVMGGFNVAVADGGRIYSLKKELPKELKAVIAIPNRPISTAYSRKRLPKRYSTSDVVYNVSRSSLLTAAIFSGAWEMLRVASKDRMHQDIRMEALPELFELQKLALENGALMSTLSGSGSTFFNMAYADVAPKLAAKLKERFGHFRIKTLDFDNEGVVVRK
jgi:homoserine kinase